MTEILLLPEVAQRLRVSQSTINRWLGESRKGIGTFPLPISVASGKCRWTSESIDRWIQSQAIATSPVPARKQRRNAKAHAERQAATDKALERFKTRGNS